MAAASKKEPNPFTENKRDAILKFYRPSDKDYAFVYVENPKRTKTRSKPKPYRVRGLTTREHWWSQRDSNPCYRRERPVS